MSDRDLLSYGLYKPLYDPNDLWLPEFADILKVLEFGIEKHGYLNYLDEDGKKSSFEQMHTSMFHHLSESYARKQTNRHDKESGLDPLLHLACRALMCYARLNRGIIHPED